jgi:ABC-type multidrug transport system fused ATPase/permease subunit
MSAKTATDDDKKKRRKEVIRRLRSEAAREFRPLLLGSFAMVASSLSNQAVPRLMGRLIDQSPVNKGERSTSSLAIVVLGGGLASFLRTVLLNNTESRIATRLRKQAFGSLMGKELQWFQNPSGEDRRSPAALGEVLRQDVSKVSTTLTTTIANALRSTSSVLFSTYHMLSLNPSLMGVAFTVVPAVGAAAMLLRKKIQSVAQKQRALASEIAAFCEERLTNMAMVQLSNRQEDECEAYAKLQQEQLKLSRQAAWQSASFMGFLFCASSSALLLVVNVGGKSVAAGRMTSGQLTSFATYSFLLGLGTSGLVKAAGEVVQGLVSADRVYALLDENEKEESMHRPKKSVAVNQIDSVAMENVSFQYKSTGATVLKNVSLKLQRGTVVALCGKNGSGKSTTTSLLAGLLEPTEGQIVLSDGTLLSECNATTKGQLCQVVLQSTALFSTTILENVRYSKPDATRAQVVQALQQANCTLDLDAQVGLNGCQLSGGERQRIALARALLSDPAVLVLDEPLSGMDVAGEAAVEDAIRTCRAQGRALLLVTHHAKSLALTDQVLVMKEGSLVEKGTFAELKTDPASELCNLMPDLLLKH